MPPNAWRRCANCGAYNRFEFYNPDTVYCGNCGVKSGETDTPVESDLVALSDDKIIHSDSDEELATVVWDAEKVVR